MLVLTRRVDEGDRSTICIGQDVEVTVVEVRGDHVRLGVKVPRDVSVDRSEIAQRKKQEGKSDAGSEAS